MQLIKAERKKSKIKIAIQGGAGSGKTYSSLLIAKGLTGSLQKVVLIDTENGSSNLYSHLGAYYVLHIEPPYTPEKYIQAIDTCVNAGMNCIIIDSISHCWDNLIEYHSSLSGNSFANWGKVTPRHKAFLQKILQAPVHVIATMRVKQDYVINLRDGKYIPEKVGLKAIQRDGVDYEFTIVFNLNGNHQATCSKDRTQIFSKCKDFLLSIETGINILYWCNEGVDLETIRKAIKACTTSEELTQVYKDYTPYYSELAQDFKEKKVAITLSLNKKINQNGITTSHQ